MTETGLSVISQDALATGEKDDAFSTTPKQAFVAQATKACLVQASWRDFDAAWYRLAYPAAERMLADTPQASPETVFHAVGRVFMHAPNPYFDEIWYRTRHQSAREAIAAGQFASGFDHYQREGRATLSPHWLFDPAIYRAQWQARHGEPLPETLGTDPYGHYLAYGQHEGLSGHLLFDPAMYASVAPYDIAQRIGQDGPFTTFLQQILAGDDPVTSADFDPGWYRDRYPAVATGIVRREWLCTLHHYLANNEPGAFDPNPRFCEQSYTAWHFDVAAAVRGGVHRNGFEHFIRAGRQEHRFFTPADQQDTECITARFPLRVRIAEAWPVGTPSGSLREGTFVLGGTLHAAYGPCLIRSLSRLWHLREHTDAPILWQPEAALPPQLAWPSWLRDLWRLVGLDHREHVFMDEAARFQRVRLPDEGIGPGGIIHDAQIRALAVHRSQATPNAGRIWLSRRGQAPAETEERVEAILASRGWIMVRPETLPLARQIDLFSESAFVSGFVSAAFLTILLCTNPRAMLLPVLRPGIDVALFDAVGKGKGVAQSFILPKLAAGGDTAVLADPGGLADAVCEIADEAALGLRLGRFDG